MNNTHRFFGYIRARWIFISTFLLSFSFSSFLQASFLGPLALLSLPSGIQSIISLKHYSDIKNELIKILPHIALLLIALSVVLLLVFLIIMVLYVRKAYRAFHRRRAKISSQLLHSLLLELTLKKDIHTSYFLETLRKRLKEKHFRTSLGKQCSHLIEEALDLLAGTLPRKDQERLILCLIRLVESRISHYS